MNAKLRLLILEDRPTDAELMLRELRRAGYEPEWRRVETEPDYLAQLDQGWELILADYNLPQFTGLRALELLKERGLDIPLIIVSASIGEDKAVEAMQTGASDYVMKDRLVRLGPAVERGLRESAERRERRQAEAARQQQTAELRARNDELSRFNQVAVGRELRMLELKREVNELCGKLGEPPRHRVAGDETDTPISPGAQT